MSEKIETINDEEIHELVFRQILDFRNRSVGATTYLDLEITALKKGWARGQIQLDPEKHLNPIGSVHGGIIFLLADSVAGSASFSHGSITTTANGTIHFINPAIGVKTLIAEATEIKAGKTLMFYDVEVRSETGKLLSKATMEYYNMNRPIPIQ